MLASITPLGERGRHRTWGITVTAFVVGSTAAGAAAGAILGALGGLVPSGALSSDARLAILAAAGLIALAFDAGPLRVPGPRRQVNEHWLDDYRGWVYGLGFGAQLGLGVTTVVTSAATYVALAAAFLSGVPGRGALVFGCYGAVRGLGLLAAAHVQNPDQLRALHRAIDRRRSAARRGGIALLAAIAVLALIASVA
jgi:hypothetical protein